MEPIVIDNPGLFTFGTPPRDAVFAITGIAHGGTTFTADCVRRAGVQLFYDHGPNLEDFHFSEAIVRGEVQQARHICYDRPANPGRWAFKRPFIYWHADTLREVLGERLCWVLVFRGPLAIATRGRIAHGTDWPLMLRTAAKDTTEFLNFAADVQEPHVLISFEKLVRYEQHLIPRLKEWMG